MTDYDPSRIKTTYAQTVNDLADLFALWGVKQWQQTPLKQPDAHWHRSGEARVTIDYDIKGQRKHVEMAKHPYYYQNIRVLYFALKAARENQMRGLDDVMEQIYGLLSAPAARRNPFEVLGVREDAPEEVITASYKALAKRYHPDSGSEPDSALMVAINEAYEAVKRA